MPTHPAYRLKLKTETAFPSKFREAVRQALPVVGFGQFQDGVRLLVDDERHPELTSSFAQAKKGANVYARWYAVEERGDEPPLATLLLAVELELPKTARFYLRLVLDRRRTDPGVIELLQEAKQIVVELRSNRAEISFPAPPDPDGELGAVLSWLDVTEG